MTATISRHHNGLPPAVSKAGKIPAPRPFPFMMLPAWTTGSGSNPNRTVEINLNRRKRGKLLFKCDETRRTAMASVPVPMLILAADQYEKRKIILLYSRDGKRLGCLTARKDGHLMRRKEITTFGRRKRMEIVTVDYMDRMVCAAFFTGIVFVCIVILVTMAILDIVRRIANRKSKGTNFIYINGKVYTDDGQDE